MLGKVDQKPEYMSVKQAAVKLNLPLSTMYHYIHQGVIPALRLGSLWRIPIADLVEYERSNTTGKAA